MYKYFKYQLLVLLMTIVGIHVGQLFVQDNSEIIKIMVDFDTESDQSETLEDDFKEVYLAFYETSSMQVNCTGYVKKYLHDNFYPQILVQIHTPPPELTV